ncbi:MAG: AEC family transporter, partial [Acidocella sp.]
MVLPPWRRRRYWLSQAAAWPGGASPGCCASTRKTLVPPLMFSNCGNLGLPIAALAFGPQALAPAVVTFLVSNVSQFSFGTWLLDRQRRLAGVWRSPSIQAAIVGLAVALAGIQVWPPLLVSMKMLGDVSIPLMLFALGARLADSQFHAVGFGILSAILRPVLGMAMAWMVMAVIPQPRSSGRCCSSSALCPRRPELVERMQ